MDRMIKGYIDSCIRVKNRINELKEMQKTLKKLGDTYRIEERHLDTRKTLTYCEHQQMQ